MKNARKHSIPSSALGYAVTFMLLVGLFSSGILFVTSTHKRIESQLISREYLLFDNMFSLHYGAQTSDYGTYSLVHPGGDSSTIIVRPWGMVSAVVSETRNGHRKLIRSALTIQQSNDILPCLFVPNRKDKIALAGDTKLEGIIQVSERGLERAHVTGKPYKQDKLYFGSLETSDKYLPPLKESLRKNPISEIMQNTVQLEQLPTDSVFSFREATNIFSTTTPILLDLQTLEGNLIIRSFERIFVAQTAHLEHVILLAPEIEFEDGFEGTVQAIASRRIICNKDVFLKFPSALMLYEDNPVKGEQSTISILENSTVLGGILLVSEHPDFRNPLLFEMLYGTIGGLVYNQGESDIRGKVLGSVFTNKLVAHVGGGAYGNHLVDAQISTKELPEEFVLPNWLERSDKNIKPVLLTCF